MSRPILALISFLWAIATFIKILSLMDHDDPIPKTCTADPYVMDSYYSIGIGPVDSFLCIIHPFFDKLLFNSGTAGILNYLFIASVFLPLAVMSSVEGCRKEAKWFVYLSGLVSFIGQIITISTAFPLLWLTSYFLAKPSSDKTKHYLNSSSVLLTAFTNLILVVVSAALPFSPKEYRTVLITAFQFIPLVNCVPLILFPIIGYSKVISDAKHGSSTAVKVYHFFAGISAAIWIGMCILAWTDQSVLDLNVWTNLLNNDPENGLLIVDGISLLVSGFLFSLVETGVISFIKTVLLSALIGPGAALLINFADRESQSLGSQTVGSSKLKLQ
ncbi:hypothetical protein BC833DRAFT_607953 [Globomyces pollinis-pini]|nr:hypothetical protein BC833DRAFT_607953 [Globomyces pollinis-pini]